MAPCTREILSSPPSTARHHYSIGASMLPTVMPPHLRTVPLPPLGKSWQRLWFNKGSTTSGVSITQGKTATGLAREFPCIDVMWANQKLLTSTRRFLQPRRLLLSTMPKHKLPMAHWKSPILQCLSRSTPPMQVLHRVPTVNEPPRMIGGYLLSNEMALRQWELDHIRYDRLLSTGTSLVLTATGLERCHRPAIRWRCQG